MFLQAYQRALKLPEFRGKARLTGVLRAAMKPRTAMVARGIVMELDPQEWTQIDLLAKGVTEPGTIAEFARILSPGGVYVDVGAHVGFHLLAAHTMVGASGSLIAVEPQPYNCEKILTNCRLNGIRNATVHVAAAGEAPGFVELRMQAPHDKARLSLAGAGVNDGNERFVVPVITLADLIDRHGLQRVDLLKIDVEGFELAVLRGLGGRLGVVGTLAFEVLADSPAADVRQITDILAGAGFRLRSLDDDPWTPGRPARENMVFATQSH